MQHAACPAQVWTVCDVCIHMHMYRNIRIHAGVCFMHILYREKLSRLQVWQKWYMCNGFQLLLLCSTPTKLGSMQLLYLVSFPRIPIFKQFYKATSICANFSLLNFPPYSNVYIHICIETNHRTSFPHSPNKRNKSKNESTTTKQIFF